MTLRQHAAERGTLARHYAERAGRATTPDDFDWYLTLAVSNARLAGEFGRRVLRPAHNRLAWEADKSAR